jgi:hypothetical protein
VASAGLTSEWSKNLPTPELARVLYLPIQFIGQCAASNFSSARARVARAMSRTAGSRIFIVFESKRDFFYEGSANCLQYV